MSRFRKKPVEVEAVQMLGAKRSDVLEAHSWVNSEGGRAVICHHPEVGWGLIIETMEGDMEAKPGDFIIQGVQGEFYPCKPDIFEATYEPASSAPATESGQA